MKINAIKTTAAANGGSVHYVKYKNNSSNPKVSGLWFARTKKVGTITLAGLAEHIEADSKIERGTVVQVIEALLKQMRELLLSGYNLKIDDFGIFSLSLKTTGAESSAKFSVAKNINGIRLLFRPSGRLNEMLAMAKLTEMSKYDLEVAQP